MTSALILLLLVIFALSMFLFEARPHRSKLGTRTPLPSVKVTPQLVLGYDGAVLLAPDGSLWGWGGTESQLAGLFEKPTVTQVPQRIGSDSDWWLVAAGFLHTVALKTDGSLWCWGRNSKGQLACPPQVQQLLQPKRVGSDTNWAQISAGSGHCLALKGDGSLWAWGQNEHGQVGNGTSNHQFAVTIIRACPK